MPEPIPDISDAILECVLESASVVVSGHHGPDGDCVGSLAAMGEYLRERGIKVSIYLPDAVPRFCRFLDPAGLIRTYDPGRDRDRVLEARVWLCLDHSASSRMGDLEETYRAYSGCKVCVDHHPGSDPCFADWMLVDTTAAATGLLVAELLESRNIEWSASLATALYAAIAGDTGNFRHNNTDSRVMRMAARLIERGAVPCHVYHHLFEGWPAHRIWLLGRVLNTLDLHADGRIAIFHVSQETLAELGAKLEDLENFTDYGRLIDGIEAVAVLCERKDGKSKVSLRSVGRVNVGNVARSLGGGGHHNAAGARMDLSLEEALPAVRKALEQGLTESLRPE